MTVQLGVALAGFAVFGDPLPHAPLPLIAETAGLALVCLAALVSPPAAPASG